MRCFLIAGALDGRLDPLPGLRPVIEGRRPDGILFAGNITARNQGSLLEKVRTWQDFFAGLGQLGVLAAVVPGSAESPLREFLRVAKDAEVDTPNVRVVHATLSEEKGVALCGVGGELTEDEDRTEEWLSYSRATASYFLRTLWQAEQPRKVLLLSVAPPGQLGGEAGNRVCGDFIDSYHPSLCVASGSSERRGVQRIGHTIVVNPGRLADGSVAWLDWNRPRDQQVEMLRL